MTSPRPLHANIDRLIDRYRAMCLERQQFAERLSQHEERLLELETLCQSLRAQLDEAGGDRFALKLLRDERKIIRRQLKAALTRIEHLEQELLT